MIIPAHYEDLRMTVVSTEGFSFNASHYTQEELK